MDKLRRIKLRAKQGARDSYPCVGILAAQAHTQGACHCAFRLAGIWTLVLFAFTPPYAQG